jgi:regulatory protein
MIPIRNRKKTLQVTVEEMRNFAFAYVEKYAPSKQQLKTYLLKKYMKLSYLDVRKKDVNKLIDIVLSDLEKNKFVNDQFYSESKANSMVQRGSSINKIRSYLIGKGINDEFIKDTVDKIKENNSDQDFFSAIKICKKKRIGPARTEDNRTLFYKKDISLLALNVFYFEVSKKVMDIDKEDYLKIINHI